MCRVKLVLVNADIFRNCGIRGLRLGTNGGDETLGQHIEVEKDAVDGQSSARTEMQTESIGSGTGS